MFIIHFIEIRAFILYILPLIQFPIIINIYIQMKISPTLQEITNNTTIFSIPVRDVRIKKVKSIEDFKELKSKILLLKKAIVSGEKILFKENTNLINQDSSHL